MICFHATLKTFDGPNMTADTEKEGSEGALDASQIAGQTTSTSKNVMDCTSPKPGLITEQDDKPKDQSLLKVDEERSEPVSCTI